MGMFSQDEYGGTFGPSPVINCTVEAAIQSITGHWGHHTRTLPPPPQTPGGPTPPQWALLNRLQSTSAWFEPHLFHAVVNISSQRTSIAFRTQDPAIGAPQLGLTALQFQPVLLSSIPHSLPHLFSPLLLSNKHSSIPLGLRCMDWLSSISFCTPKPTLLQYSSITFCTP